MVTYLNLDEDLGVGVGEENQHNAEEGHARGARAVAAISEPVVVEAVGPPDGHHARRVHDDGGEDARVDDDGGEDGVDAPFSFLYAVPQGRVWTWG